jgi:hypothetical protein
MMTYRILDREYDYVVLYSGGFVQRCANIARLRRAVRIARSLGYRRMI